MKPNLILSLHQRADRALFLSDRALGRAAKALADERVRVKAHARWAGLADDVYTVAEVVGSDENAMCKLRTRNGQYIKWFRAMDLEPAQPTEVSMSTSIDQRAATFEARVTQHHKFTRDWNKAMSLAQTEDAEGAEAHRLARGGGRLMQAAPGSINLSVREGDTFDDLAQRYANEHGVTLKQAVHEVGKARPDLAAARG